MKFKVFTAVLLVGLMISGCIFFEHLFPPEFTEEQCQAVSQNFDKLREGMSKEEVVPLIGGERRVTITLSPGKLPSEIPKEISSEIKTTWTVWALCNNPEDRYKWLMIAFDTETDKVVKIFSGNPEYYRFF